MLSWPSMLLGGLLLTVATLTVAQRRGQEVRERRLAHRVQHGQCSYTFLLPEPEACAPETGGTFRGSNSLQRDSLNLVAWPTKRMQHLEKMLENNTQRLQKLERYIQTNLRLQLAQARQHMVQNQTAAVLELGTSLLNQTTAQAHRLTDMEAQVLNQTSRMEIQMQETSLSTNKLEKQLFLQGLELHRLQDYNSFIELQFMYHTTYPVNLHLIYLFVKIINLISFTNFPSQKQAQLVTNFLSARFAAERVFQDCAEIQSFGANTSGVYTIHVANMTEPRKVFCDMEANGGGWTLIQRRANGSVNFQRNWKDYKQGFGDLAGEHWLGNELVHHLTSRAAYSLRVELQDWEGNEAYAQYERFQLGSEGQLYRLSLSGYSGSAGPQSSLALEGTNFSTRDADNDNCLCKCAQMLSGGWWFDACGLSNLNGIYYPAGRHLRKLNGIRWHYFQGPSYSLRATRMMVRPIGT
ncbi:PREDICTED: angiopoietin-4 [Myotis brandtii]|uniref:angiopoietin-4 n=1 Tax=Myotis brandtii TaxID=109478 RepID=UPI000703F63E|nr:PREDICTED: angiopoietin-4 [Myotis brandtii]